MSKHAFDAWLGKQIKGYRLEEILGVGGVGCVFRGTHHLIGKQVAIKILQHTDPNAKTLERFFTEARAVNEIKHENVIDIIDFDQTDDKVPFMIMEYLSGESLADLIEAEAPLPEARIFHIATQICAALFAAHERGIIHRDLKGDNIFLTTRGEVRDFVKILDFGIAKILYSNENPTQNGLLLGTPLFMAPEQALGQQVNVGVDIYALGVLMFQMCTGRSPFEHDNLMALIQMHLEAAPPSPRVYNPNVSGALERIILRCLKKAPAERFVSMKALASMLALAHQTSEETIQDPGARSLDTTSPFIALPSDASLRTTQQTPRASVPLPFAPTLSAAPEKAQTERVAREASPEQTERVARGDPARAAAPSLGALKSKPEVSLMPTLIDPVPAANNPLPPEPARVKEGAAAPSFATEEQTAKDGRSMKSMVEKILSTAQLSALEEAKAAPPSAPARGSYLLLFGFFVVLGLLLMALWLGLL